MDTHAGPARAKTADIVRGMSSLPLELDTARTTLAAGGDDDGYFGSLAAKATELALGQACSSLLAGQGNESDETADVGFCLGKGEFSKAETVLEALGLPTDNITTMSAPNGWTRCLDDEYYFRIEGPDSWMIFFLVGSRDGVWGGVVGAGVWT